MAVAAAARAAARHSSPAVGAADCRLYELGAGTGALTQCLDGLQPVLVEKDAAMAAVLGRRFPQLEVRIECATQVLEALQEPVGIVSSIPLLNNPQCGDIKRLLERRHAEGLIRYLVLYSYGLLDPLRDVAFSQARRAAVVWRSVPPASVWVYR